MKRSTQLVGFRRRLCPRFSRIPTSSEVGLDVAAYNEAFNAAYPLREKWVGEVVTCIAPHRTVSRTDRLEHHVPTSHKVGMERARRPAL